LPASGQNLTAELGRLIDAFPLSPFPLSALAYCGHT